MQSAYIDPGTGSMLFTILIGVVGALIYSLRLLFIKLRYKLGGGGEKAASAEAPLVIFSDNRRYWATFEPICRELDACGVEMLYFTPSPDDPALSCGLTHLKAECIENENKLFSKLNFLQATVVLSTTPGLDVYQWKRSKGVRYYVHIAHAPNDITLYRMFGLDYYDAILLSGQYQADDIRALEELRGLPEKELRLVGLPYMDVMEERLKTADPVPEHTLTVLLAPSWGSSALFGVYGGRIIDELLKTGYHIIVRPHPQSFTSEKELMEKLQHDYPESEQLEWNRDRDNFDVLNRSDIMVSDFSGVIFEFALIYDKPVIYTDPDFDLGPYDAWWLEKPLWTVGALPRIGRELTEENMGELRSLINECINDPAYAMNRHAVKAETWCEQGKGAVNVCAYLKAKIEELSGTEEVK